MKKFVDRINPFYLALPLMLLFPWGATYVPACYDLLPMPNALSMVQWALAVAAALVIAQRQFPKLRTSDCLTLTGLLVFFWHAGVIAGVSVTAGVLLWTAWCRFTSRVVVRLLVFFSLSLAAFYLRASGFFHLGFWWCYVHFLKFLSIALCGERSNLKSKVTLSYFFSVPFLLGPLSFEWMNIEDFANSQRFELTKSRTWGGIGFLCWGAALLTFASFLGTRISLPDDFFNAKNQFAPIYLGGFFFLLTFSRIAGSTAIAAGYFRLMGCSLPYDFQLTKFPLTHLEFCQRYHGNAKGLLSRYVFLPVTMGVSQKTGWKIGTISGIGVALFAASVSHYFSFIPMKGVPFRSHLSASGSFNHRLWEAVFILITIGVAWFGRKLSHVGGRKIYLCFQAVLTGTFVLFFFFNTYAQGWLGWTNLQFLRAITLGLMGLR